jgi:L-seryl-tRNA(Ser) seleniumtransferase
MLGASDSELLARAQRIRDGIGEGAELIRAAGKVGGGALPLVELEGPAVALIAGADPVSISGSLRAGDPPVLARIHDGRVLLDPRTLGDDEVELVVTAARRALAGG